MDAKRPTLIVCEHCNVHHKRSEAVCPHCGTSVPTAVHAAAALVLGAMLAACNQPSDMAAYGVPDSGFDDFGDETNDGDTGGAGDGGSTSTGGSTETGTPDGTTTAGSDGGSTSDSSGGTTAATGSDTAGSDTAGSDTAGSDTAGSDTAGSDTAGSDTGAA